MTPSLRPTPSFALFRSEKRFVHRPRTPGTMGRSHTLWICVLQELVKTCKKREKSTTATNGGFTPHRGGGDENTLHRRSDLWPDLWSHSEPRTVNPSDTREATARTRSGSCQSVDLRVLTILVPTEPPSLASSPNLLLPCLTGISPAAQPKTRLGVHACLPSPGIFNFPIQ